FDSAKSGNIYIFAHDILLPDKRLGLERRGQRSECRGVDRSRLFAVSAAGLRGGRGGAGSIPACFYPIQKKNCRDEADVIGCNIAQAMYPRNCAVDPRLFSVAGGMNAVGGRGGDAGDVAVYLINSQDNKIR